MKSYSIADNFDKYFQVKFVNSKELKEEAYKIRYGVYCKELGWLIGDEAEEMESDECDDYSYHCLLEHRRTKAFAGCIRIIIPPMSNPSKQLPFEENCLHSARTDIIDSTKLARGSFSEISRLAVLDTFRRRAKERNVPYVVTEAETENVFSEDERRNFPNIAIGLYLAALALSGLCNHKGVFVMMETRLSRRLTKFGFPFKQAGDEMDYHGVRALFYLDKDDFYSNLSDELLALYEIIYSDISQQLNMVPYTLSMDNERGNHHD